MRLLRWCDRLSSWAFAVSSVSIFILAVLTAALVIARYFFAASSIGLQELQWHLFAGIFLLAIPHTLKRDAHVRVDILYQHFSQRTRHWIDTLGTLLFLLPTSVVMLIYGIDYVEQARSFAAPTPAGHYCLQWLGAAADSGCANIEAWLLAGEGSADPGGLPARWIVKALIPTCAALLAIQSLAMLTQRFHHVKGDP